MRKLGLLCSLVLVATVALAQEPARSDRGLTSPHAATATTDQTSAPRVYGQSDDAVIPPAGPVAYDARARAGDECPAGSLCGQNRATTANTWQYSDRTLINQYGSGRIICESFPPPGQAPLTTPVGILSWHGTYLNDSTSDGCTKPHLFEVKFYANVGGAPNVTSPVCTYTNLVPIQATHFGQLNFGGNVLADEYEFTVVLNPPCTLASGWFSVASIAPGGQCYLLLGPSDEGDGNCWRYWENAPTAGSLQTPDIQYCMGELKVGACCDDRIPECLNNSNEFYCNAIGGRFLYQGTCGQLTPPCGQALGACCSDDGNCALTTFADCEGTGPQPPCYGDLNCDGQVSFADINPFVLYLSNYNVWLTTYAGCDPENGDINGDNSFPSFGDINAFVTLLSTNSLPIICSQARVTGDYWAGWGTTCDAFPTGPCCTVPVPPGAVLENEPEDCADDVFNGGCNLTLPLFSPITVGQTVYGESGTFDNTRDMDWYRFAISTPATITITAEAEFDPVLFLRREGPGGLGDCTGSRSVAVPLAGTRCVQAQLVSRCLPAGTYYAIVAPATFEGVRCYSDYKVTVNTAPCEPCTLPACPAGAYVEGTVFGTPGVCNEDTTVTDTNGGCNETPSLFEPLAYEPDTPFTVCGSLWSVDGTRDLDWYSLNLTSQAQVTWEVDTEIPIRATMLFDDLGGGNFGPPPSCDDTYIWTDTLYTPCVHGTWDATLYYQPGTYWFLVMPEDADGPVWYAYPCPMGTVDLGTDYQITFNVSLVTCDPSTKPHGFAEAAEALGPGYNDTYNSGCDAASPPGPRLTLGFGSANGWVSQSGTWFEGEDLKKDYDWYQFTVATSQRFKVYLYADFAATWEIWPANNCAAGPVEGADVPPCTDSGIFTVRCYPAGTYWLRIYPTGLAPIGKYYYLALTEYGSCSPCSFSCVGTDLDDPCDDVTDYDTNAGCDDPDGPAPHYMTFACGGTYCGRVYAKEINGLGYFDPDWFQITQTNATAKRFRLTVTAEFIAHVEVYASCTDYLGGNPVAGMDAITTLGLTTQCPNMIMSSTTTYPQGTTVYGRITIVDQFGTLMTDYYPCAKGYNRWKIVSTCVN